MSIVALTYMKSGIWRFKLYWKSILIKKRVIGFWYKLVHNTNTLSSTFYRIILNNSYVNNSTYPWLSCVKNILDECGLSYVWYNQTFLGSKEHLLKLIYHYILRCTCLNNERRSLYIRPGQIKILGKKNVQNWFVWIVFIGHLPHLA